jgi:SAM-dependent methyltransferase
VSPSRGGRIYRRLFAAGYDRFLDGSERAGLHDIRRDLLADATGRTLEIGAGTGLNLDCYPPAVTELVATEPDRFMAGRLQDKLAAAPGDRPVTVIEAPGERLPFEDDSFDTAALTLVLCTAPDPSAVLAEVARVLRPGGLLLFLEHVRAPAGSRLERWQDRLHGPWKLLGAGCHCNRATLGTIEASPLAVERVRHGSIPRAAALARPMIVGAARAPTA